MDEQFRIAILCSVGTAFFFGLNPILIKKGFEKGGSQEKGTFYMLLSHLVSMMVLVLFTISQGGFLYIGMNEVVWLVLAGISNFTLAFSCYFRAISILGPSRTASIVNVNPSATVVLAVLFLGESVEPKAWLGIIAILIGAYLVGKG